MILALVKDDIKLNRRIERLDTMQNLFKYWHVAPFAFCSCYADYYGYSCCCYNCFRIQMDFLIMEQLIENILIYSLALILCITVVVIYLRKKSRESKIVDEKIKKAKEEGLHEPVSLHPVC